MQVTTAAQPAKAMKSLKSFFTTERIIFLTFVSAIFLLMTTSVMAGGGGDEFDEVWDTIEDWTTGTLGKIIAGAMILVGIIGGVARQSLMAFAVGIAGAMGLNYAPEIVSSIMSASIEGMTAVDTVKVFSNGLL